jgi:hypothetical protein
MDHLPWDEEQIFRFRGIFRSKPPVCVTAPFLRTNDLWLFSKMFARNCKFAEPPNELYTYPDGRTYKVYPLDIPDAGLDMIFCGFMWQYKTGYITDYKHLQESYNGCKELRESIPFTGWINLLRYYGFMNPSSFIPGLDYVESPRIAHFRHCADIFVKHIVVNHPEWKQFERGIDPRIKYQFFNLPGWKMFEYTKKDGMTMFISYDSGKMYTSVGAMLTGMDNGSDMNCVARIIHEQLVELDPKFTACILQIDEDMLRLYEAGNWPLSHTLEREPPNPVTPISSALRPLDTDDLVDYPTTTMTLKWISGHQQLSLL